MAWLPESLRIHGLMGAVFARWHPEGIGPLLAATLVFALVWDFFQYWSHRLQHSSRFMWAVHGQRSMSFRRTAAFAGMTPGFTGYCGRS